MECSVADQGSAPMHSVDLSTQHEDTAPPPGTSDENESAALMDGSVKLVDWRRSARPAEAILLCLGLGLVWSSMGSIDWLFGVDVDHHITYAGLRQTMFADGSNATWLNDACIQDTASVTMACPLASAGLSALVLMWIALFVGSFLGVVFVVEELDRRDYLGLFRGQMPNVRVDRLTMVPLASWVRLQVAVPSR